MDAKNSKNTTLRFLTFSLAEEKFAIPLLQVKEVIAMPETTPIPQTPSHFNGIMNLRGQVITVLDLRTKLGIKANKSQETAVIICDLGGLSVGVVVDSVNSVLAAESKDISDKPELTGNKSEYITGVYQSEKSLILLLDIAKTLNLTDLKTVKANSNQNPASTKAA